MNVTICDEICFEDIKDYSILIALTLSSIAFAVSGY